MQQRQGTGISKQYPPPIASAAKAIRRKGYAMLTPSLTAGAGTPLYEQLYRHIRSCIENGELAANDRLPSRRNLAEHAHISPFTVDNAYRQLLAEGYVYTVPKRGYFVCDLPPMIASERCQKPSGSRMRSKEDVGGKGCDARDSNGVGLQRQPDPTAPPSQPPGMPAAAKPQEHPPSEEAIRYDLKTNAVDITHFPYSVWSRLMRECMRENPASLLAAGDPEGDEGLRREIAHYLHAFRGMEVDPSRIVVGAGTEYLIGLITELVAEASVAFEDPGYDKIPRLLAARHVAGYPVPVDDDGIRVDELERTPASLVVVTPSNHFPTGAVMGIGRRTRLLDWASQGRRYIIEDDFDSEFRFVRRPIPTLHSLDRGDNVIYLNSFATTLTPSLRIAYLVLPLDLMDDYRTRLRFYSSTVSRFEQLTLKRFLERGYYERHLNRMRGLYKARKSAFLDELKPLGDQLATKGQDAGLHLVLTMPRLTEKRLVSLSRAQGVGVRPLSRSYAGTAPETHAVVAGYAGFQEEELRQAARLLVEAWGEG